MRKETKVIIVALAFLAGLALGEMDHRSKPERIVTRTDTLVVTKEIRDTELIMTARIPDGSELVPIGTLDSLRSLEEERQNPAKPIIVTRDSMVYIQVPMEDRTFEGSKDSVEYKITAHGYNTEIRSVSFKYPERIVTRTETRTKRWTIGVTAGPAILVTPAGKIKAGAGITAGATWNF